MSSIRVLHRKPSGRCLTLLLVLACAAAARADAVLTRSGGTFVGEVTEEGDHLRVRTSLVPEGVLIRKSEVVARYPSATIMLEEINGAVAAAERSLEPLALSEAEKKARGSAAIYSLDQNLKRVAFVESIYPESSAQCRGMAAHVEAARKRVLAKSGVQDPRDSGKPGVATEGGKTGGLPAPGTTKPGADIPEARMFLNPPAGSNAEEIAAAARVVDRRLSDYGCDGVTVSVVERAGAPAVRFTSNSGLTRALRERIRWFGFYRGASLEGRLVRRLTALEAEEFGTPDVASLNKVTPPDGARWLQLNTDEVVLVWDKPVVHASALSRPVNPLDPDLNFEMPAHLARAMRGAVTLPAGSWDTKDFCLVMDDHAFRLATTRLVFEADKEIFVKGGERFTPGVGQGAGMKHEPGHLEARPGKDVWVWSGLSADGWRPIRIALKHPLQLVLTHEE